MGEGNFHLLQSSGASDCQSAPARNVGEEVRHIPWERVLTAIKLRDAASLRVLAEQARCDHRRELLQVFAGIVENSAPIAEGNRERLSRIAARPVRDRSQQPFPTEGLRSKRRVCYTARASRH